MTYPNPRFDHLVRLSDETGLLEHAWYAVPRRRYGYTTDDNARGLLALCREPEWDDLLGRLAETYLAFLRSAQRAEGTFRNRLTYRRTWADRTDTDDATGRAIWALGTASRLASQAWMRQAALEMLELASGFSSPHLRSNAFSLLGAVEVLESHPGHEGASSLLERGAAALPLPRRGDEEWPWPEEALTYGNARLTEALVAAGSFLGREGMVEGGLLLLRWLIDRQTRQGHLSPVSHRGWRRGGRRMRFDQQPLEAAAIASAARRAWEATGNPAWAAEVEKAARWLLGENDLEVPLLDPETGGCYDGLTARGPNLNQGAESTLAAVLILQDVRAVSSSEAGRAAAAR